MKKFFYLLLLAIFSLSLAGCKRERELATPENVKITGEVVSWNAVEDADGYVVKVDSAEHSTSQTSYDLSSLTLAEGAHQVSVKATSTEEKLLDSKYSGVVTYTVLHVVPQLAAPTVTITDGVASWNAVANATGYVLKAGTKEYPVDGLTFDLADNLMEVGQYQVSVKAKGNGTDYLDSAFSANTAFNLTETIVTEKHDNTLNLLLAFDGYTVGMEEDDFDSPEDYDDYLGVVEEADTILGLFVDAGLSYGQISGGIQYVYNFDDTQEPTPEVFEQILSDIEALRITPDQYAGILLNLISYQQSIQSDILAGQISDNEGYLEEANAVLTAINANLETDMADLDNYIIGLTDPTLTAYNGIIQPYFEYIVDSSSAYSDFSGYSAYNVNQMISLNETYIRNCLLYDQEYAKGEAANQTLLASLQLQRDNSYINLNNHITMYFAFADYNVAQTMITEMFEMAEAKIAFQMQNEGDYQTLDNLYLEVRSTTWALQAQESLIQDYSGYIFEYQAQLAQVEMTLSLLNNENVKGLLSIVIENMFLVLDELDWELLQSFMIAAQSPEGPTPADIAGAIQELVRLMDVASDNTDYQEIANLLMPLIVSMIPDLTAEQQDAIEALLVTVAPQLDEQLFGILGNIDQSVIEKVMTFATLDEEDMSKVNPEVLPENMPPANPELGVLIAQIYVAVIGNELPGLLGTLEAAYGYAAIVYPMLPPFDFDAALESITPILTNIAIVSQYTVGEDGFYTVEQIAKITEFMTQVEGFVLSLSSAGSAYEDYPGI